MRKSVIGFTMLGIIAMIQTAPTFGISNASLIRQLTAEKQKKMKILEKCAKKVKGFQIAGISTLGVTAAGVAGNVVLAKKNKSLDRDIVRASAEVGTKEATLATKQSELKSAQNTQQQRKEDCDEHKDIAKWEKNKCTCLDIDKTYVNGECKDLRNLSEKLPSGFCNQIKQNFINHATTQNTDTLKRLKGQSDPKICGKFELIGFENEFSQMCTSNDLVTRTWKKIETKQLSSANITNISTLMSDYQIKTTEEADFIALLDTCLGNLSTNIYECECVPKKRYIIENLTCDWDAPLDECQKQYIKTKYYDTYTFECGTSLSYQEGDQTEFESYCKDTCENNLQEKSGETLEFIPRVEGSSEELAAISFTLKQYHCPSKTETNTSSDDS